MKNFYTSANRWVFSCLLILLLVNISVSANQSPENTLIKTSEIPQQCLNNCATRYGSMLGNSPAGVPAYSNCNSDCVIFEPNRLNNIYTGIKWQCVEYARRWLLHEYGVVFGDVDIAANIWSMQQVQNPISNKGFEFISIVNGAESLPQRGDLLIYGKDYLGTGHVAVVVGINAKRNTIQVAEQNYDNTKWQDHYARKIPFIESAGKIWLLDSYLVGWKRVVPTKH
jgi:hypothetical protein